MNIDTVELPPPPRHSSSNLRNARCRRKSASSMRRPTSIRHVRSSRERERERVVEPMKRLFYCTVKSIASPKSIEERKKERFEEKGEGWIFFFFFFQD